MWTIDINKNIHTIITQQYDSTIAAGEWHDGMRLNGFSFTRYKDVVDGSRVKVHTMETALGGVDDAQFTAVRLDGHVDHQRFLRQIAERLLKD